MAGHLIPHQIITSLLSYWGYLLWVSWSLVLCQWEFIFGIDSIDTCPFSDVSIRFTQGFTKKRHIIEYNYPKCSSTESLSLLLEPSTQHQVNSYILPLFLQFFVRKLFYRWTVFHQGSSTHITCTSTFNTDTPTVSSKLTWSNLKSACLELFPSMTISEISTIMENVDLLDSINHLSVLMDVNFSSLEECVAISKKVYESSFLVPDSILTKICQVLMHLQRQT